MSNVITQIRKKISELEEKREQDLKTIASKVQEAEVREARAAEALNAAVEAMDSEAYKAALADQTTARTTKEMYIIRREQIGKKEVVSEAESDEVIQALLSYEQDLETRFRKAIGAPIKVLGDFCRRYEEEVQEAEELIYRWTTEIHPYYINELTTRILPDGTRTHRMEHPQPVHGGPYKGCAEALCTREYLKDIRERLKDLYETSEEES